MPRNAPTLLEVIQDISDFFGGKWSPAIENLRQIETRLTEQKKQKKKRVRKSYRVAPKPGQVSPGRSGEVIDVPFEIVEGSKDAKRETRRVATDEAG